MMTKQKWEKEGIILKRKNVLDSSFDESSDLSIAIKARLDRNSSNDENVSRRWDFRPIAENRTQVLLEFQSSALPLGYGGLMRYMGEEIYKPFD